MTWRVETNRILEIQPHTNADALEIAIIEGWHTIVKKGAFVKDQEIVYIPEGSVVSQELEDRIFGKDSKIKLHHGRVKTIKLRGEISQGIVLDANEYDLEFVKKNTTKYEPPAPKYMIQGKSAVPKKQHPDFEKYTKLENIKWRTTMFEDDDLVVATEKLHGTNFRCGYVKFRADTFWKKIKKFFGFAPELEFVYGSHNVQLQNKLLYTGYYDKNVYAEAVEKYNLKEKLIEHNTEILIFGEIYGDGIQKNYNYGCKRGERKLAIFDVKLNGKWLKDEDIRLFCAWHDLQAVPLLFKGQFKDFDIEEHFRGTSKLSETQKVREGVVLRSIQEDTWKGSRKMAKCINPEYLLKDNTEYH